jgi:small subunit ribosomal protein S13
MARIAGVVVPDDKHAVIALTYVHGIGRTSAHKILEACGLEEFVRLRELSEADLNKIRDEIAARYTVEGELQRIVTGNIKRLRDIGSYRGDRHKKKLPARGQRTRTNARTKRGKRLAVGGSQPKAASKT